MTKKKILTIQEANWLSFFDDLVIEEVKIVWYIKYEKMHSYFPEGKMTQYKKKFFCPSNSPKPRNIEITIVENKERQQIIIVRSCNQYIFVIFA